MKIIKAIKARFTKSDKPGSRNSIFMSRRRAGVVVTQDNALTYSAVWRCVSLISQSIGALPWAVNERTIDSEGRKSTRRLLQHPAANILDLTANDEISAQAWRETMAAWALTWGNGYSEIERDLANRPVALWPISPDRVTPTRDDAGRLVYVIANGTGPATILQSSEVFHLHGLGFDGTTGYSIIQHAAATIGLGLATEEFGSDFFGNGAHVGGVYSHPNTLGDAAIDHLKTSLKEKHGGKNQLSPMILEEGMTYTPTSIPPDDAQFLETRKFNVAEVARWYGVPLHKLHEMDKSSFNNIEHQSIEYVQDALIPWIRRFEIEANIKLVSRVNRTRVFTKLNLNSLLRGDLKTRGEYYKTMSNLGVFSVNDILELEDRNPIGTDGDKRLVQLNQTTLDKIGEEIVAPKTPIPGAPNEEEVDEDLTEANQPSDRAREILVRAFSRSLDREKHRAADALKRYDGDRAGLIAWMDKFYNQHADYMRDALTIPLEAMGYESPNATIDLFLEGYSATARNDIADAFDHGDTIIFSAEPESMVRLLLGA